MASRSAAKSTQAAQARVANLSTSLHGALDTQVPNAFVQGLHRGRFVAASSALVVAVLVFTHLPRAGAPESRSAPVHA
ncbi:MAG TPA: hypothetical protein VNF08_07920 [Acidimicrobiales bacterium]|nr:hypothetical protein [Acidimicrobiales bacterium]